MILLAAIQNFCRQSYKDIQRSCWVDLSLAFREGSAGTSIFSVVSLRSTWPTRGLWEGPRKSVTVFENLGPLGFITYSCPFLCEKHSKYKLYNYGKTSDLELFMSQSWAKLGLQDSHPTPLLCLKESFTGYPFLFRTAHATGLIWKTSPNPCRRSRHQFVDPCAPGHTQWHKDQQDNVSRWPWMNFWSIWTKQQWGTQAWLPSHQELSGQGQLVLTCRFRTNSCPKAEDCGTESRRIEGSACKVCASTDLPVLVHPAKNVKIWMWNMSTGSEMGWKEGIP